MRSLWKFFTSLRLTVVCLAIGLLLVFFGTWAQVDEGLWNAQERWFKSFFIWWGPQGAHWKLPVFPGGYLLGIVLLLNLTASHIKRFQWGWRKLGIHLTHAGIILLLLGQLMTDKLSRESHLRLREGESKSYSESSREDELVFARDVDAPNEEIVSIPSSAVAGKKEIRHPKLPFAVLVKEFHGNSDVATRASVDEAAKQLLTAVGTLESEYSTPEGLVAQAQRAEQTEGREQVWRAALKSIGEPETGDLVAAAKKIATQPEKAQKLLSVLKSKFKSAMLARFGRQSTAGQIVAERIEKNEPATSDAFPVVAPSGFAKEFVVVPRPESYESDTRNMGYAIVELVANGASLGTWLVHPMLQPQEITVGAQQFRMAYRFERYYQPFNVTLLTTTHEVYPGTVTSTNPEGIPRNFQSRVRIDNPNTSERREVDIYMNNPLRYAGLTFYQYQMGRDEMSGSKGTSTFQVVKNPGWLTPYVGVIVVAIGMLYQFLYHLINFVAKRRTAEPLPTAAKRRRTRQTAEATI